MDAIEIAGTVMVVEVAAMTLPSGPYAPANFIVLTLKGATAGELKPWNISVQVSYLTN
jgi:hypothetical protein